MIEFVDAIFTTIILIPGFLCIYIPHKILGIKVRISNFELTLLSLIISLVIFAISSIIYATVIFINNGNINITNVTSSKLVSDYRFILIYIILTTIIFYIAIKIIRSDGLRFLRKKLFDIDAILSSEKYVWDIALKNHKGHAIVETTNNEYYLGVIDWYTIDSKEKEILLKNPERLDVSKYTKTPINKYMGYDIDKILFLTNDIRRIYLIPKK